MQTAFMKLIGLSPPPRVQVNLNAITSDGLIRVRESRSSAPVEVGQLVEVFEPAGEVEGIAKVARVNTATGLIYLDIRWDSLRDLAPIMQVTVAPEYGRSAARSFGAGGRLMPKFVTG